MTISIFDQVFFLRKGDERNVLRDHVFPLQTTNVVQEIFAKYGGVDAKIHAMYAEYLTNGNWGLHLYFIGSPMIPAYKFLELADQESHLMYECLDRQLNGELLDAMYPNDKDIEF